MYTPEVQAFIAEARAKALTDELDLDTLKRCVQLMRENRSTAVSAPAERKKKVAAAIPSADDLLNELGIK